jgi:hypothetical protein
MDIFASIIYMLRRSSCRSVSVLLKDVSLCCDRYCGNVAEVRDTPYYSTYSVSSWTLTVRKRSRGGVAALGNSRGVSVSFHFT